jgi:hypothetical protein
MSQSHEEPPMSDMANKNGGLKDKVRHELIEYAFNVVYLTLVFAAFTVYRRLMLSAYDISYTHYGFAVIEALVLGKVIMIGGVFRLGRGFEDKPLIYPTLYKTVVFTLFCAAFTLAEHAIKGLVTGKGVAGGLAEFAAQGYGVILGNSMVVFVALVPFFAMKELGRVIGRERIAAIFFRTRTAP